MKSKVRPLRRDQTLATMVEERLEELSPYKTHAEVAEEMGFVSRNFVTIIKSGKSKLALNRVADMARVLDMAVEPLFLAALRQYYDQDVIDLMRASFAEKMSPAERDVLDLARTHLSVSEKLSDESKERIAAALRDAQQDVSNQ